LEISRPLKPFQFDTYYTDRFTIQFIQFLHALLNTGKLPVYSTCRLCQQTQALNLLVVVQGQCSVCCAADESGVEGGFPAP
jgi:hypothetical protein